MESKNEIDVINEIKEKEELNQNIIKEEVTQEEENNDLSALSFSSYDSIDNIKFQKY